MCGLRKLSQDQYSDKWQVEILGTEQKGIENWVTKHVTEWTFVEKAFKKDHSTEALAEWSCFQGTIEVCVFWLQKMHSSWYNYGQFRLRNTITNEIIPAELFI